MLNKKVESEIAIGIIVIIAVIMGGLIWIQNSNLYAYPAFMRDKATIDSSSSIVFLGDSLTATENWNRFFGVSYIANAGISGNTTDDVISRLDSAIKYKPQKLFLMIGINDLFQNKDVSYIVKNYETILNKIKLESPATIIYLQSVLPVNNDIHKMPFVDSQKIIDLNEKIMALASEQGIFFIDLYPSFCGADNKMYASYALDGAHLSAAGYEVWKKKIIQYVKN